MHSTPGKILLRHSTIHIQSHVSSLSWKGKVVSVTPLMVCANNLWDVAILLVRPHRRDPPPSWLPRTQAWVLNTQACLPKSRAWLPKTRVQFSSVVQFYNCVNRLGAARIQLQDAPGGQIPLLEAGSHLKPYSSVQSVQLFNVTIV